MSVESSNVDACDDILNDAVRALNLDEILDDALMDAGDDIHDILNDAVRALNLDEILDGALMEAGDDIHDTLNNAVKALNLDEILDDALMDAGDDILEIDISTFICSAKHTKQKQPALVNPRKESLCIHCSNTERQGAGAKTSKGEAKGLMKCSRCESTIEVYCCKECQLADWSRHKKFCKIKQSVIVAEDVD
jgi:hypothetical protein